MPKGNRKHSEFLGKEVISERRRTAVTGRDQDRPCIVVHLCECNVCRVFVI